jgi:hypothetical protein
MIAVVKGIKPRDQIEALLASQMAGVHTAAMPGGLRAYSSRR